MEQESILIARTKLIELSSEHGDSQNASDWFISKNKEYSHLLTDTLESTPSLLLKSRILFILGEIQEYSTVNTILITLENNTNLAWECCQALGKINTKEAVQALINLLKNKDPEIVKEAIKGLGISKKPEAASSLYKLLGSPDENVRFHTVQALIPIHPIGLENKLKEHLKTEKDEAIQKNIKTFLNSK